MSPAPRRRVVCLTLLVVLGVVQPMLAGAQSGTTANAGMGDVGTTVGPAIERHPSGAGATADALRAVRADAVHERGHTGAGVAVGVVGRGFATNGALDAHVADRRRVGDDPRATTHDTAVAEVVSETAPDADLYLAGVGRTPTPAEYAAAVEWLTARGVDVIVDSGSYFPSVAADERRITAAAERASERGVVFVTSAGNYADRHWAGEGTADGWVAFAEGDAANALADGDPIRGRVTVRLRWRTAVDYDLYLYRRLPNGADRVVAKSTADETGPGLAVEGVDVAVPRGRYYVAVYADTGAGDGPASPGRVQVFAARHELEHTAARGSMVAPATSDRVVAVGAVTEGKRARYSSLSDAGAVDLTAPATARTRADPRFAGTSAAAPYVAGTAALVEGAGGDPSPARVEAILERTADGGETVDALAAVEAATADGSTPTDGTATAATGSDRPVASTDDGDARTWPDATTDPDGETADAATAATERSAATNADRSARNVTRSGGDGRRSGGATEDGGRTRDGRTDRSSQRNRDDGADRSGGRDRAGSDGTDADDRRRRDGSDRRER